MVLQLEKDRFAVPLLGIHEVRAWERLVRLPQSADYVLGVLDIRGTLAPVIDLRLRLGRPARPACPTLCSSTTGS